MKKLLILENNKPNICAVNINTIKDILEDIGYSLTKKEARTKAKDPIRPKDDDPDEDICYIGTGPKDWEVCLRRVYVPDEYGEDLGVHKMTRIIKKYDPNCILCHLGLLIRGDIFWDYPSVRGLMQFADKDIEMAVYTGTDNLQERITAASDGKIKFFFNGGKMEKQKEIIQKILDS